MDTDRSRDPWNASTRGLARPAALGGLAAGGLAAAPVAAATRDIARGQTMPGLRREQPNRFVLGGEETQITYAATAADGGPRLTYDGPYGSQSFEGDALTTEESALGRLVTADLGPFPDQGELWLTLLLPPFREMTMWNGPAPFATLAILKWLVSTIAGPPQEGAIEEYEILELDGTAEFVVGRPEGVAVDEVLSEPRIGQHDLPPSVEILALSRVTLPAGEAATAVDGAHLFVIETGTLTVDRYLRVSDLSPRGVGHTFLVSYDEVPPAITNVGAEPAVALVVSLALKRGVGILDALPGWTRVERLAVADAASVDLPLFAAGGSAGGLIAVALVRVIYEAGASVEIPEILAPATHLLAVESGALDVMVADPAVLTPADGAPQALSPEVWVSLIPGDHLLVPAPGRIATHNVVSDEATVLFLSLGAAAVAAGRA